MKQSSTESSKKKLVQARLPFQILSPGVKNPAITTPEPRKRKASENASEDVQDCETTEVKENQEAPVEKKLKVNSHEVESAENGKATQKGKSVENKEEKMEVEDEAKSDSCKTVTSNTPASKGKSKTSKPKSSIKQRKNSVKAKRKTIVALKKDNAIKDSKNLAVDIVDLTDSPIKADNVPEKPSHICDAPTFNLDSSLKSTKENNEKQDNKLDHHDIEESNRKRKRDEIEENITQEIKSVNLVDQTEEKKDDVELPNKMKEIKDNCSKASDTLINNSKTDIGETHSKIAALTDPVTNDSSDSNLVKGSARVQSKSETISSHETEQSNRLSEAETPSRISHSSGGDDLSRTPSLNGSSTSVDVSLNSECSTPASISATPKLGKKNSITPRRLTPKQIMKTKEKELKNKEKERIKQEREQKKAEEKEEKQRLKQEKEEEKLKQKQEKEEEKRKEKEEKERKKQAEILQKNEEKRLKEEEKRLKEEEKKAKEEERKKREDEEKKKKEEKRLREEQKAAEKRKSAQAFASFFVKSETKADEVIESTPQESNFQPFEVKNDMRLAPLVRCELTQDRRQQLDTLFLRESDTHSEQECTLYIEELRRPTYVKRGAGKTWPAPDDKDDDVIFIESEKPNGEVEADSEELEKRTEKKNQRAKLLQFHENRRPPYWGTWRKNSKFIRPRAPLNEDKTMFEYDIDSDDEWEEPEDGESLRGSEDEESQDEQYEEDNDMFVPHGYLSDEEGQDELDDKSPEAMKAKLKFLQMEFEAERNEKQEKLKPRLIGCVWFCNSDSASSAVQSHITELFLSRRAVWDGPLPLKMAPPVPTTPPSATPSETGDTSERGCKKKVVPESMIPTIIRVVHGSQRKLSKLLVELQESCEAGQKPSKRCLADKIREMADWTSYDKTGRHCWYVKEEVRRAYDLMDLTITPPTPSKPPPLSTPKSNITKFTKVLTSDERLRLLSTPKETTKPSPAEVKQCVDGVKTPSVKLSTPAVKKRVLFTTLGPAQGTGSMKHFVSVISDQQAKSVNCQTNDTVKKEEPVKKRITPITLTSTVAKPPPPPVPPSQDDCVVLSD